MPIIPDKPSVTPGVRADQTPDARRIAERVKEHADPVERADRRRRVEVKDEVRVDANETVTQKLHGNMDETLIPEGKNYPDLGPNMPEHDHVHPDLQRVDEDDMTSRTERTKSDPRRHE
jgi:hypothetical protein